MSDACKENKSRAIEIRAVRLWWRCSKDVLASRVLERIFNVLYWIDWSIDLLKVRYNQKIANNFWK